MSNATILQENIIREIAIEGESNQLLHSQRGEHI